MSHSSPGSALVRVAVDERPELLKSYLATDQLALASDATPTQVANPKRTTWRSLVQLFLAIATALPQIIPLILGAWDPVWLSTALGQVLLVHGVAVRIMALPGVNDWLLQHAPALAAIPSKQIAAR